MEKCNAPVERERINAQRTNLKMYQFENVPIWENMPIWFVPAFGIEEREQEIVNWK